ncbi:MAG: MmgE/PrpD family protein [Pseudomonadota bacterium]
MTEMQTLAEPSDCFEAVAKFVRNTDADDIPDRVLQTAKLLTLDLIGVLAAAAKLDAGVIARNHAANHWAAGEGAPKARMLFDGRPVSLPGFAFAMATQLDNLDAHDGWQPSKGHAGAALFPALAAFAEEQAAMSGREALINMVIGYELSYRAAAALHATVEDYHTSGAWNALGCVAMGARLRGVSDEVLRHALGIAEYHAPRSQMMREIANPTMLHDGTGFGAPVGVYALLIAEDCFTGAPAALVEFDDASPHWSDLGHNWLAEQQYIKPYPICRWAHAPIDAALDLRRKHDIKPEEVEQVDIFTFAYSADLSCTVPTTSPMAQYSLAWPVAAALVRGRVGVDEILPSSFSNADLIAMTSRIKAHVAADLEARYPQDRLARMTITLKDGRSFESGETIASGGPDPQPTEAEVVPKFRQFAGSVMTAKQVEAVEKTVLSLDHEESDFKALVDLLADMKLRET